MDESLKHVVSIDSDALDPVREHKDIDHPFAIKIPEQLQVGTYDITIEVTEDGNPWENTRTVKMKINVVEPPVVDEESTE